MKLAEVYRIGRLFRDQQWPTDDSNEPPFPFLFTRFCRMIGRLPSEPQRQLVLRLTSSYRWIKPEEYHKRFWQVWQDFLSRLPDGVRSISVARLPVKQQRGAKSSDFMSYMVRSFESSLRSSGRRVAFRSLEKAVASADRTVAVVIVDDYVGSGDTLRQILEKVPPATDSLPIFVLVLAAQKEGVAALAQQGCTVIAGEVHGRGISDCEPTAWVSEAHDVMTKIEVMLRIGKKFQFGYGRTEGLVSMRRTPNNTFPLFWTDRKVHGERWDPPFPRYGRMAPVDDDAYSCPMPSSDSQEYEAERVLESVSKRYDAERLVEHKIAYSRVLRYLEEMIADGLIYLVDGDLKLTPRGELRDFSSRRGRPARHREPEKDEDEEKVEDNLLLHLPRDFR